MNKNITVANAEPTNTYGFSPQLKLHGPHITERYMQGYAEPTRPDSTLSAAAWKDISEDQDASVLQVNGNLAGLEVVMTAYAMDELQPGNIKEQEAKASTTLVRDAIKQHAGGAPQTLKLYVQVGEVVILREYTLIMTTVAKPIEETTEEEALDGAATELTTA